MMSKREYLLKAMIELKLNSITVTYRTPRNLSSMKSCCIKRGDGDLSISCESMDVEKLLSDTIGILEILDILKPILDSMDRREIIRVGEILIAKGDKYSPKRTIIRSARSGFGFTLMLDDDELSITMSLNTDLQKIKKLVVSEILSSA